MPQIWEDCDDASVLSIHAKNAATCPFKISIGDVEISRAVYRKAMHVIELSSRCRTAITTEAGKPIACEHR